MYIFCSFYIFEENVEITEHLRNLKKYSHMMHRKENNSGQILERCSGIVHMLIKIQTVQCRIFEVSLS